MRIIVKQYLDLVSTQYFYFQKFENLIHFTIAKKKCGILIKMVGGGLTTLIKDDFFNKKCDLVLFEMGGCRPQWIYLCSNTHQTGGDVTNSKSSLLALLFCYRGWWRCPEVYSVMMCNSIFVIHASNIVILIICILTQPG